ncbi:alpha/beta fold hydrolase [Halocatena salina]|uniref:Alpha/beta hydrolase n=1 Tax=Halocatena salina TaxID=2934340 RepID=A0A8U0A213_9EURY|nr:alpha/beta hydrolase [Halocatena salina]UPM43112.1 alpha/beta hydrolase [Halocatena salina]
MVGSRRTVRVGSAAVSYIVSGRKDAPAVVLLHGGGFDATTVSWRDVRPALSESFRVYALDWPGYGESDPPERTPTTEYYIEVLDGFLDAVGIEQPALLGVSLGGGIALGYALAHPTRVRRLVAVDSYGLGSTVPGHPITTSIVGSVLSTPLWWLIRRSRLLALLSIWLVIHPPNLTTELFDDVLVQLDRPDATNAWQAFQRAELGRWGVQTNYVDVLPALSVPTLFVHGEQDALVPVEWAQRAAMLVPCSDLRVLSACGHWAPRERPDAVVDVARPFLVSSDDRGK